VPTYQYACTECDHAFEQFQSFSDDALTVCPQCQGRLRKIFNAVGVVFKGSGFYRNDSRADVTSGNGASTVDATSGSNGTSDAGSSGSGDSSSGEKSATKSDKTSEKRGKTSEKTPAKADSSTSAA
jgi:putative FmdB family regulatory protein